MRAWSSRLQVEGGDGAVELFGGVGADDGAGHTGTLQEPGERDLGRRLADLGAQLFVLGQLPPEPVELPGRDARVVRPAGFSLRPGCRRGSRGAAGSRPTARARRPGWTLGGIVATVTAGRARTHARFGLLDAVLPVGLVVGTALEGVFCALPGDHAGGCRAGPDRTGLVR